MLLYLVRHGDAETLAPSDDERTLSEKGRKVTAGMGELLHNAGFPVPDLILASPLPRANETARIIAQTFAPKVGIETSDALRPSRSIEGAMNLVASKQETCETLMIVGHDPLLSCLVSALICGANVPTIEMKKSAVALFEIFQFDAPRMRGVLKAFLPPRLGKNV